MARYGIVKATAIIKYIIFEALYALNATKIGKSRKQESLQKPLHIDFHRYLTITYKR